MLVIVFDYLFDGIGFRKEKIMSNVKNLADLLRVCSVLPALLIMPAVATEYTSDDIEKYPYTVKAGDSLLVTQGYSNAENGVFHNNGTLTISDDLVFANNNTVGYGGTIYLYNKNTTNTKIGNNVVFSGGTALEGTPAYEGMAGAIYTWSDGTAEGANVIEMGDNVVFRDNSANDGGAIYTYGYNTITVGNNLVVENNFSLSGNGAIVLNGYDSFYGKDFINTMNVGKNAVFKNNTALLRAGAVYIGGSANDMAVFDDGAVFSGNASSYGGAVSGFGTFEFGDVVFDSNIAYNAWEHAIKDWDWGESYSSYVGNGGAILNRGEFVIEGNASFTNNYAEGLGGAIHNGANSNMTFMGDIVFSGNKDNVTVAVVEDEKSLAGFVLGTVTGGTPNDIYNIGTLNIASGTTTLDGGITGTGELNIQQGAVLNVGYATVEQGLINIDGTLNLSVKDASSGIQLFGDVTGTGTLSMMVGIAGVYDVSNIADTLNFVSSGVFDVTRNGDKLIFSVKSADDVAIETGVSKNVAGTVAKLADADDENLQLISWRVQESLAVGDKSVVETELAKANPDEMPVGQTVAASLQNQIVSVASGRMSVVGSVMGRAGGDEVQGAGVWAQGLFNKSKFADKFNGYTRGFALGADTVIAGDYTVGIGLAFNDTDVHSSSHIAVQSNSVFAYGQYKPSNWYLNGTISYSQSEYENSVDIYDVELNHKYDTFALGMQVVGGYEFDSGVVPEFGMRYLSVTQDKHIDSLGRVVEEMNNTFVSAIAGFKYGFGIQNNWRLNLRPELRAAVTYDVISDNAIATVVVPGADAYYIDVENLSRFGGEFGIGLTGEYNGLEISVMYDLGLRKDYVSQTGMIRLRAQF